MTAINNGLNALVSRTPFAGVNAGVAVPMNSAAIFAQPVIAETRDENDYAVRNGLNALTARSAQAVNSCVPTAMTA